MPGGLQVVVLLWWALCGPNSPISRATGAAGVMLTHGTTGAFPTGMVRLSVALIASMRSAPRLAQALQSLMIAARLKSGCLGCSAWTDTDYTVHYQEDWATERDMRERVRSDAFTTLLAVVEASEGLPRLQFEFVTTIRGLDYIEEVRQVLGAAGAPD